MQSVYSIAPAELATEIYEEYNYVKLFVLDRLGSRVL